MRYLIVSLAAFGLVFISSALQAQSPVQLKIKGMMCSSCGEAIETALKDTLPAIEAVNLTVETGEASLQLAAGQKVTEQALKDAVSSAGNYKVINISGL